MRNLKRALSLAMASVMLLGMMVVGTGASYKDVTSKENQEAIEVLQAAGVMVGDEKGNFNPDQNVTRNEMAVIMANLMDYRVASYEGTSPFTDVPSWAEPYVAACYTNGITSGMSATIYGGDQTVTTSQAALMLMKALGYFQYQSDFGDDWQLATVKQANKIDLFLDVDSGVREAMTRNDVAQLVLNTLEAGTVEADDDTIKVEADNVTVEAGSIKYNYITSAANYASAISTVGTGSGSAEVSTDGSIVELGEKLYQGALKKSENVTDGFGAPANKWVYNNKEIGTYAKDADYVFEGKVKSEAVYDALGKTAVSNTYTWDVYVDGDKDTSRNGTLDGSDTLQKQVQDNDSAELKGIGRGATTYIYVNDKDLDGDGTRDYKVTVSVVNVYAAEIAEIKNAGEDDRAVVLNDTVKDLDFETSEYEEEDVVLYTKSNPNNTNNNGWTVESIIGLAERVEGEITRVKVQDSIVVDGTTYKYSQTFNPSDYISTDSVNEQVAFYKDTQGNIILLGDVNESNDYAYVANVGSQSSIYGDGSTYGAKLILTDGTILKVTLEDNTVKTGKTNGAGVDDAAKIKNYFEDRLVAYTKEDDGTYSLSVRSNKLDGSYDAVSIKNGASAINGLTDQNGKRIYADKNTVFMICESKTDDDYSIYVGYNNVPDISAISGRTDAIAYGKDGIAKVVFLTNVNASGTGEVIYVLGADNDKLIKDANGDFYEFSAVVKGEVVTLQIRDNATVNLGGVDQTITYLTSGLAKNSAVVATSVTYNSKGLVTKIDLASTSITDGYKLHNGTKRQSSQGLVGFDYNSATNEYDTYLVINDDAVVAYYDGTDLTMSTVGGITTDRNDKAYVAYDDGEVIGVLVIKQP